VILKVFILTFFSLSCAHQHERSIVENRKGINEAEEKMSSAVVEKPEDHHAAVDQEMISNKQHVKYSLSLLGNTYEAFTFISLLKQIEIKGLKISGLSGRGMGTLVAALYAKYGRSNMVEWILFKYVDRFFPFRKEYEKDYKETLLRLVDREFKNKKTSSFKLDFKVNSLLNVHQYLRNEIKKEQLGEKLYYSESVCVHESGLYQEDINLCFFASSKKSVRHDDIDRKSFALKWYSQKELPLIDVIEEKTSQFREMVKGL